MKYGSWTIIDEAGITKSGKRLVTARCVCGSVKVLQFGNLRSGRSTQCSSCAKRDRPSNRRTHGEALIKTVEWRTWRGMRNRCEKLYNPSYKYYGARGISVCARWQGRDGFKNFLADMGRRPDLGYSIERKNNDGNYEPGNCVWATALEQARNRRPGGRRTGKRDQNGRYVEEKMEGPAE